MNSKPHNDLLDASDVWLVPRNGRVVFDARGNSSWQWPGDDAFSEQDRLQTMDAADLRIAEPVEIRRTHLPWVHESERVMRSPTSSSHALKARPPAMR
jgi:hypothetical protein